MPLSIKIYKELEKLPPDIKGVLINILEELDNSVKKEDFNKLMEEFKDSRTDINEIKQLVREITEIQKRSEARVEELALAQKRTEERVEELAIAQKRTEERVEELAIAQKRTEERVEELATAQKRTEERVEELAIAQKRTEERVEELAEAQRKTEVEVRSLAKILEETRKELGGLSRSVSYGFENEAYRNLPKALKDKFNIEVTEKFIRTDVGGEEINFLAKAKESNKDILIVGEAKLRLDADKKNFHKIFRQLEEKVKAVRSEYSNIEIKKLIVTHFATKKAKEILGKEGILLVQSFDW